MVSFFTVRRRVFLLPVLVLLVVLPGLSAGDSISKVFNYPNPYSPAAGTTTIVFFYNHTGSGLATLSYYVYIYNLAGHRVLTKLRTASGIAAGSNTIEFSWNGRTDRGDAVPPGVYYVRIVTDGGAGSVESVSRYGKMMIK